MIRYPREQQMREVINAHAPLAGLQASPEQVQILARACAKAAGVPLQELPVRAPGARPELSASDRRLLGLVAEGLDNTQIAWRLKVSHGAARQRVSSLMRRLGVENRVLLVARGFEWGLLPVAGGGQRSP